MKYTLTVLAVWFVVGLWTPHSSIYAIIGLILVLGNLALLIWGAANDFNKWNDEGYL